MTLKDLQARAKELGIKGYSKMKKDELAAVVSRKEGDAQAVPNIQPFKLDLLDDEIVTEGTVELPKQRSPLGPSTQLDWRVRDVAINKNIIDNRKKNAAKRRRKELRAQGFRVGFVN